MVYWEFTAEWKSTEIFLYVHFSVSFSVSIRKEWMVFTPPQRALFQGQKGELLDRGGNRRAWSQLQIRFANPQGFVQRQERWILPNRAVNTQPAAQRGFGQGILGATSLQLTRLFQSGEEWSVTWSTGALRVMWGKIPQASGWGIRKSWPSSHLGPMRPGLRNLSSNPSLSIFGWCFNRNQCKVFWGTPLGFKRSRIHGL